MFNSKSALLKLFVTALFILGFQTIVSAQKKPNVIFILGDDVGYDLLSVNGNKSYSTPNIDSMAHHGINFTHCEGSPLCSPSRTMLLTGEYNFRNYSNWGWLDSNEKTFGNVMQDAGYKTAFFGKSQLPFSYAMMANWGFNSYSVFEITGDSLEAFRYKNPTLVDNNGRVPDSVTQNKYCDDILTNRVINFIDSNANNPFFIYYSMSLVHAPFSPTPKDSTFNTWNPRAKISDTSYFGSMISYMDFEVGSILNELSKTGLQKNTIIVFAGDNGTPFQIYFDDDEGENLEGEKRSTTEGGTHVPLIAYWPSHIQEGNINDDLIDFTDFLPTFAEAAGIKDLSKYGTIDGLSFYSRMLGIEDTSKPQLFMHYSPHPGFDPLYRWVRNKEYKLYKSANGNRYRFYNIQKDEKEKIPLQDNELTDNEKAIKKRFKEILDSMPECPNSPEIKSPFVNNITATTANIGATILNTGSTSLVERGSNIAGSPWLPLLGKNTLKDSIVSVDTFSQTRINLSSQTLYNYSLYAMNANASNNTGYVRGKFYTLSQPPLTQPSNFTACVDTSSILLNWNNSIFPTKGATKKGYVLLYSADSIILNDNINGISPYNIAKNAGVALIESEKSPKLLDTSLHISDLKKNTKYYFLLIPYTWNGTTDSTCNYLTQNALSIVTPPLHAPLSFNVAETPVCYGKNNGSITVDAINGDLPYEYSIDSGKFIFDSVFTNLAPGTYKVNVKDHSGCIDSQYVKLKSPQQLKLNLIVKDASCTKKGEISASAKYGFPPYLYSINNGEFDTISDFQNLKAGDYKIAVKDSNQCTAYLNTSVRLNTKNCTTGINISPNPSNAFFKVTIGNDLISSAIKITVYDTWGRLVYFNHGTQIGSYKFGDSFEPGIYLVKVKSGSNTYTFRIIKN